MEYRLIRSGRRTLAVEITCEGAVLVRAPFSCPQGEIDRFLASRTDWIAEHAERRRLRALAHPEPCAAEREALIARARAELPERVERYARAMGLRPSGIRITGAKKRFGSCSGKNSLCFSWRLMQYPAAAVDYVVVHELAHIVHKNHGPQFYALVESVMPDWRERRRLLAD